VMLDENIVEVRDIKTAHSAKNNRKILT